MNSMTSNRYLGQSEEIQQLRELKKKHNELKTLQTQLKAEKPVGEELV